MYGVLAIVACCAIVPLAMAAVALVNSLGKRKIEPIQDRPEGNRDAALPPQQERRDPQ